MDVQKYKSRFTGKAAGSALLTLAAVLALWLFIAADLRRTAIAEISRNLIAINAYKAAQLKTWRETHSREAARFSRFPLFAGIVEEELSKPGSRHTRMNSWLNSDSTQERYASIAFFTPEGAVIAATKNYPGRLEDYLKEPFARASRTRTPLLTDLYLAADGRPRMTMISPISAGAAPGGKTLCLLVINIDPETEFYPLVKAAPLLFATAETTLSRREGENVLFLSDLDYRAGSALKLTHPLSDTRLPAAKALNGYSGFHEGVDYRGERVFSAVNRVEGSDWAVITKVDRKVILAPVRTREHLALALLLLAAGLAYGVFSLVLRARKRASLNSTLEMEKMIALAAERLLLASRAAGLGVWDWDVPGDRLAWDDRTLQLYGVKKEEFKGDCKAWLEGVHPEDRARCWLEMEKVLRGETGYSTEFRVLRPDGTIRHLRAEAGVFRDADGKPERLVGVNFDVTDRRLAKAALEESEARYRTLVEASVDGILTADLETRKFRFANPAICRMLGYTAEELTGLGVEDIHPKDALPAVIAEFEAQARGEKTLAAGLPCLRKDGTVFYADINTARTTIDGRDYNLGMFRDITERRRAEEALRASEERLRVTLEETQIGTWDWDLTNDTWYASATYSTMLGYPPGDGAGDRKVWLDRIHPEDKALVEEKLRGALNGVKDKYQYEARIKHADGTYRWVAVLGNAVRLDRDGKPARVIGVRMDIDKRKRAELEVEKLNRDLLEKHAEMENFLYITTHDLRGPLINMLGFSQNLERYAKELREALDPARQPGPAGVKPAELAGERIPSAVGFIAESARRMDSLISSLLKVSRAGRVEMKPAAVDMNELAGKVLDTLRYQLERAGGEISCGDLPPCKADPGAVSQIFTNLLDNAVKYRAAGRPPRIKVAGERREDMVLYTVADNGAGIPASDLGGIWNLFHARGRSRPSAGEGIGLHMVRRLAEKNGGRIWAESKEGEGSVFHVGLPAAGKTGTAT